MPTSCLMYSGCGPCGPIEHSHLRLAGDDVIHHLRKRYNGTLILVGIDWKRGAELLREGFEDLIAFGRDYIANPDLVERIRLDAALNERRPEGYYGSSAVDYADYPFSQ